MKNAIIFDLDGTLWDATNIFKEVYDIEMKKLNIDIIYTLDDFKSMMGFSPMDIVNKLSIDLNWDKNKSASFFKGFYIEVLKYMNIHHPKLYDNEEKTLKELSEIYDLYIVSNSSPHYVENYLSFNKLDKYFKGFIQAGDTGLNKADNIVKLIKDYDIKKAIYIGDTIKDYLECLKINIPFVFASYGFGKVEKYKFKLDKIEDLIKIKDSLFD